MSLNRLLRRFLVADTDMSELEESGLWLASESLPGEAPARFHRKDPLAEDVANDYHEPIVVVERFIWWYFYELVDLSRFDVLIPTILIVGGLCARKMKRHSMFLISVELYIWMYYAIHCHMIPLVWGRLPLHWVIFSDLLFIVHGCLWLLVNQSSPGFVPDEFRLTRQEAEHYTSLRQRPKSCRRFLKTLRRDCSVKTETLFRQVRFCERCLILQCDRSSHDDILERCVLRYHHFSRYVENAIGLRNIKQYVQCLVSATVVTVIALCVTMACVSEHTINLSIVASQVKPPPTKNVIGDRLEAIKMADNPDAKLDLFAIEMTIIVCLLMFHLASSLSMLLLMVQDIQRNVTPLDSITFPQYLMKLEFESKSFTLKQMKRNVGQLVGENGACRWFVPWYTGALDGTQFPVADRCSCCVETLKKAIDAIPGAVATAADSDSDTDDSDEEFDEDSQIVHEDISIDGNSLMNFFTRLSQRCLDYYDMLEF